MQFKIIFFLSIYGEIESKGPILMRFSGKTTLFSVQENVTFYYCNFTFYKMLSAISNVHDLFSNENHV